MDNCKLSSVQSGIATEAAIADELSEAKCRSAVIGFSLSGVEVQNEQSVIGSPARAGKDKTINFQTNVIV